MFAISDTISGRRGIEGVQQLIAADAIQPLLQRMLAQPDVLRACHLRRAKYKPGHKVTAYYDVVVADPAPCGRGSATRPIAVTWTQPGAPQKLAADEGSLGDEIRERGLAEPFVQLIRLEPDVHVHLQVAPLDPLFPQLTRLADPNYAAKLLGEWGGEGGRWAVTPIRYRPRQRHLLHYVCHDGENKQRTLAEAPANLYAKIYAQPGHEHFCTFMHQLADWFAASQSDVSLLRPLAYLPAETTILYEQVVGKPLSTQLGFAARSLRQTGAALRMLHDAPQSLTVTLPALSIEAELKAIVRTCEHIQVLLPNVWQTIHRLLAQAAELYATLPQEAPTFVHGDFKADHVLVEGNQLTLIDFDSCALGDSAFDIGKFLADLSWSYADAPASALEQAHNAFLSGYALPRTHPRLQRARVWQALIGIKIIAHRVCLFDAAWAARTSAAVQACAAAFGQ